MRKAFLLFIALYFIPVWAVGAILLDRILAVVNGEVISLSEVERELFFFRNARPLAADVLQSGFSDEAIQQGIQELIDLKLLLSEARRFDVEEPSEAQVQEKLDSIRNRFSSPQTFENALRHLTTSVEDLRQKIREHWQVDRFIEQRIRFFVIVLPDEISRYYSENQERFEGKPLEEVEPEIQKLLAEKKEEEKLKEYLSKIKAKASIQVNF